MATGVFLDLTRSGARAPLITDLVLHEADDPEAVRRDGPRLARVIAGAARRLRVPLAWPLMDLRLEKADLLAPLGHDEHAADRFHFAGPLDESTRDRLLNADAPRCAGSVARDEALRQIAEAGELIPVGMTIGPFSLATKLLADPITPAALLGSGVGPEDDPQVRLLLDCLKVGEHVVQQSIRRQLAAGARALLVCEPTASTAYLSPRQIQAGSPVFERLVLEPNLRLRAILDTAGADLVFHDCGGLTDRMVEAFGHRIHPAVLSLGGSRTLWDDARLVPDDVVLFGNLPTKSFYSDAALPVAEVERRTAELLDRMRATGHPFLLGSECDVLHVPEAAGSIRRKIAAMLTARAPEPASVPE